MIDSTSNLYLEMPSDEAIDWVIRRIATAGMQALRTFDLQVARIDPSGCPCPQHGTARCNCQMVVLLVYDDGTLPVSLVAHSSGGKTWLSLIDTPQQHADPRLENAIRLALTMGNYPDMGLAG